MGRRLTVTERLRDAINAHDLDAMVACFAADYKSAQPAHPGREFEGADKVRENWTSVFGGVPDIHADLVTLADVGNGVEIGEWDWTGTYTDGKPFAMRGVTVVGTKDGVVAWGRLYMENVEEAGGIDEMVHEAYRPPGEG